MKRLILGGLAALLSQGAQAQDVDTTIQVSPNYGTSMSYDVADDSLIRLGNSDNVDLSNIDVSDTRPVEGITMTQGIAPRRFDQEEYPFKRYIKNIEENLEDDVYDYDVDHTLFGIPVKTTGKLSEVEYRSDFDAGRITPTGLGPLKFNKNERFGLIIGEHDIGEGMRQTGNGRYLSGMQTDGEIALIEYRTDNLKEIPVIGYLLR